MLWAFQVDEEANRVFKKRLCILYTVFIAVTNMNVSKPSDIYQQTTIFILSRLHVCVLCNSHNKFCLSSYTAFTGWGSDVAVLQHFPFQYGMNATAALLSFSHQRMGCSEVESLRISFHTCVSRHWTAHGIESDYSACCLPVGHLRASVGGCVALSSL